MEGITDKSNLKASIQVARNVPLALVVGVAGFIGSHLAEELIKKGIQVIGVDDFSTGNKNNLNELTKESKFHLVHASAENINLDLERLDYLFIVTGSGWNLRNILELGNQQHSKIVLLSTIDLYDSNLDHEYTWFKEAEGKVAKFASENKLNARVLRLSAVFGPRMHFRYADPINRLIQSTVSGNLAKENTSLEFSTRALYVKDAVDLIIKSMLKGSTASKIYDGVGLPIKIAEIRQILLDPLWHEARRFKPSELPPWSTPNLNKTMADLTWKPQTDLVVALKRTINYFKDNEIIIPETKKEEKVAEVKKTSENTEWEDKIKNWKEVISEPQEKEIHKKVEKKNSNSKSILFIIIGWIIILYGVFYPLTTLVYGVVTYKYKLDAASNELKSNNFDESISDIGQAKDGIKRVEDLLNSLEVFSRMGILTSQLNQARGLTNIADNISDGSLHAILGAQKVSIAIKKVVGEDGSSSEYFVSSQEEFALADFSFSKAKIDLQNYKDLGLPDILNSRINNLSNQINFYEELTKKIRTINLILPQVLSGNKSYLVILGQEAQLRPGGGHISSVARVDIEKGKLKKIESVDSTTIDNELNLKVEPPAEIKALLGKSSYTLSDSNFEPDFPTNAKLAAWFYNQEYGKNVDGVIFWDVDTITSLLNILGPVQVSGFGEVNSSNLVNRAVTQPENSKFLNELQKEILNKLFFVPNINLSGVLTSLNNSSQEKHMMVYLADPNLLSLLVSERLAGSLPRQNSDQSDFIAFAEANLGSNNANFYVTRTYQLNTLINSGKLTNTLRISYTNGSGSNTYPEGEYKNQMRVYLPVGVKIINASFGEDDIKSRITSKVDYGREVVEFLIDLKPKEQKTLTIEYQLPQGINNNSILNLDLNKQSGTFADPFVWTVKGVTERTIQTDLSTDRQLQINMASNSK